MDIQLKCSRSSRVAVIGPNGAGKSTAIKLLIGELEPSQGTIWKHPSLRLAYVAQHAFQHLEQHIKKTPTDYILWRFAGNDDKESVDFKKNRKVEEVVASSKYFLKTDPQTSFLEIKKCFGEEEEKKAVFPEKILSRKENRKEKIKEYEIKWKGNDNVTWVNREILIDMGAILMVQRFDEKEAIAAGLIDKPLTSKGVEKHLSNFGIEAEQASHTQIGSLSGGQKVKVVLGASMWQNPHVVILDEPTNYLDRDGLGALTKAIEEFEGGVIIISHNREFANAVSQEKWIMDAGRLRKEGDSIVKDETPAEGTGNTLIGDNIVLDSQGNEIKINKASVLSDKDKKNKIKQLQKKIKTGKKTKTLSQQEVWDIEDEIAELKGKN
jgi:elongation factor 3